jgi:hypothetical protein
MPGNKKAGDAGEHEVIRRVACPNCGKPLDLLAPGYPLFDVQCSGCSFRAQVKSPRCAPRPTIAGAGWDVLHKVLKSGYLAPPLLLHFRWPRDRVRNRLILFYPFIPLAVIRGYTLSQRARRPGYKMFNYAALNRIPHFVLHEEPPGVYAATGWCGQALPLRPRRRS